MNNSKKIVKGNKIGKATKIVYGKTSNDAKTIDEFLNFKLEVLQTRWKDNTAMPVSVFICVVTMC